MQCPRCGGPVTLNETDAIIQCGFCRTRNIIHTYPYPCFYIKPRKEKTPSLSLSYVPYWRFKGLAFSLGPKKPGFKVIDQSFLAVEKPGLPVSMGLRSQTQTLYFMHKGVQGLFLAPGITRKQLVEQMGGTNIKTAFIGEILSLVFMPFFHDSHTLYDGLTGKEVQVDPAVVMADKKAPAYNLSFTPGLCPDCGWDLTGETDSLVHHCSNCQKSWLIHHKRLSRCKTMFFNVTPDTEMLVPVWRFKILFQDLSMESVADFMRTVNIPRVVQDHHETAAFYFYIPAFKVSPKIFLRLGRQVTLAQIEPEKISKMPAKCFHPVDLSLDEGFQAVIPVLMDLCTNKKDIWPVLSGEKMTVASFSLVYMGFRKRGNEYIQDELGFSLQRNVMKFGRGL